jgi:hypothetical protein
MELEFYAKALGLLLEQGFPALQQGLELLACSAVGLQCLDVRPIVGELALEIGDQSLAIRDLGLQPLEL